MKQAVIVGYSGHAYVMLDILLSNKYTVVGYCEKDQKIYNPFALDYLGVENNEETVKFISDLDIFVGIGNNKIRQQVTEVLERRKLRMPSLIHSSAIISKLAHLEYGTVIMPGVVINAMAQLGKGIICNSSSVIEHECIIGNYVHVGPGAVLTGGVEVGSRTLIGANSVIRQGVRIGDDVIIGAGSVVTKNIDSGQTFIGNPARVLN